MYLSLTDRIKSATITCFQEVFPDLHLLPEDLTVNEIRPELAGDYAVVLFPFLKRLKQRPDELGQKIGDRLLEQKDLIASYEVVKGFLNLTLTDGVLMAFLQENIRNDRFGWRDSTGRKVMVEYSSPNTNKPIHFGHLRNNFLGWSVSEILKSQGIEVIKANLVNDRGIHICKSMVAWQRYADGQSPADTGIKGDHLVGHYYVRFNDVYKEEVAQLLATGKSQEEAEKEAPIMLEAQALLRKWEAGDPDTQSLWKTMNGWVYEGFEETYKKLGIDFDKMYYESDTYLLGKEIVQEGLDKGILFKKEDDSVWIDLTEDGLDQKLLLRGDGTSVYMTQDLGTARLKYRDFTLDRSIYVIADEQNYHMQVLKLILQKLGEPCAEGIYHLSYGMVELPSGRMKSREGTVVDADDMISEMSDLAKIQTENAGKTIDYSDQDKQALYDLIGLGALKFYLLRVEPKKKMVFDPKESIDLHGFTATFVQYAHARICSILRKVGQPEAELKLTAALLPLEKALLLQIEQYPATVALAARELNPSVICNYIFALAQLFNSFFDKHSVIRAESPEKQQLRLYLAAMTAKTIRSGLNLLGIEAPEKM